ncbi:MAG: hypothetical protein GY898_12970 [Proteobacteria bacterium]|nr:hypothetical protein [Pseudomonadota bacterium]
MARLPLLFALLLCACEVPPPTVEDEGWDEGCDPETQSSSASRSAGSR